MGRKGTSKRKEKKTKVTPVMNDAAAGSVSSVMRGSDSLPAKSIETGGKKNSKKK